MPENKKEQDAVSNDPGKEGEQVKTRALEQARHDPRVKEALKKEKQPETGDDLSPLHNTREIGTSGGDQRASITETRKANENSES